MKKCRLLFVLVLFAVLCLLTLSSCGGGADDATTADTVDVTTAHEHVWVEGTTTDLSACVHETQYVCSVCGETKTETTETHVWGEEARLIAPP
ncbi:MAG: hypothetical protein IKN36_00380, partial [Clostridia bacterium]|nr:hypothetical protein [Clostridia bacterium]